MHHTANSAILVASAFALALLLPQSAVAYDAPDIEALFGATNIIASTGNKGVTTGVSKDGDITVLSWPSPSYYDQLYYASGNGNARMEPLHGASPRMGVFSGIVVEVDGALQFHWLRDWEREVAFTATDSSVVVTTFSNATLGLTVEQYDVVPKERDVLFREYVITRDATSTVTAAWIMGYANLQPTVSKINQFPVSDFALDHFVDFLGLWNDAQDGVLHFHPGDHNVYESPLSILSRQTREFGPLGLLLATPADIPTELPAAITTIDDDYAPGTYIYFGSSPAPDQHQVGTDASDFCATIDALIDTVLAEAADPDNDELPIDPSALNTLRCGNYDPIVDPAAANDWTELPQDAFDDALDGELSGALLAGAQVNSALRVPLQFEQGQARASLHFAFGASEADASALHQWAKGATVADERTSVETADAEWTSDLKIPAEASTELHDFIVRAFLNLRVGTDRQSGAIVASIARQPSYQVDWPRDGAFFNAALDLAGKHELVEQRADFYSSTIRTEVAYPVPLLNVPPPGWPDKPTSNVFPPGSWEMNYYADGSIGGVIRLEIDNTALILWSFIDHAGFIEDDAERRAYLMRHWQTIRAAADFLEYWRDPETGLIWPANEDDHIEYTQGLQGCGTAYLGLVAASRAAKFLGEDERSEAWARRAGELESAIMHYLYDDEVGFTGQPSGEVGPVGGVTAWIGWPIRILDYDDPRLRRQLEIFLERELAEIRGETPVGSYPTKTATSVALAFQGEPQADAALEIANTLATVIAEPGVYTIGEAWVNDDVDGDGVFDRYVNAQAPPHLWSAILVYITVVAYYEPERFDLWRERLPEVEIPTVVAPGVPTGGDDAGNVSDAGMDAGTAERPPGDLGGSKGCGCAAGEGDASPLALVALLAALKTARRRRPKRVT